MKYVAIIIAVLALIGCDNRGELVKGMLDKCPGDVTFSYTVTTLRITDSATITCRATREERIKNGKGD